MATLPQIRVNIFNKVDQQKLFEHKIIFKNNQIFIQYLVL